ncbi:MAG: glycosyltransferase [Desulfuromonadales bacterium]|nr:glycosyltransferase [Desulfuromonadales bacterium]
MNKPLLSIVIPTHNRCDYATASIQSILSISSDKLQLVVTDTSNNDDLHSYASSIEDKRFLYVHITDPLSMTDNHNAAMSLATGKYVCLIGDDDTITRETLEAAEWADANGVKIVSPLVVANYAWPDFRSKYLGASHAGRLYLKRDFGNISLQDSRKNLAAALNRGALGTEGLPKIYHGIARKDLLDSIRDRSGAYFHGSSPDVSGAVALALVSDSYVEIDYPLTLPGASGKSNTGRSALKKHKGTLAEDSHTKRFKNLKWPAAIPGFTSVETVWAQSVYETLQALEPSLLNNYNFFEIYAACLLRHFDYRADIVAAVRALQKERGVSGLAVGQRLLAALVHHGTISSVRFLRRASRPTAAGGRDFVDNLGNIHEAQAALAEELSRRGVSFARAIESSPLNAM